MKAENLKDKLAEEKQSLGGAVFTASTYKPHTVQHIVLFRFKDNTTAEQIQETRRRFLALKTEALRNGEPYIIDIQAGSQSSGEGAHHGFEEGFIVTFKSEGDRNYYVGTPVITDPQYFDPAHQAFKDFVGPLLAEERGVLVFDFAVGK